MNRTATISMTKALLVLLIGMLLMAGKAKGGQWTPTKVRITQVRDAGYDGSATKLEVSMLPDHSSVGRDTRNLIFGMEKDGTDRNVFHSFWNTRFTVHGNDMGEGTYLEFLWQHPSPKTFATLSVVQMGNEFVYFTNQADIAEWCADTERTGCDAYAYTDGVVGVGTLSVEVLVEPGITLTVRPYVSGESAGGPGLTMGVLSMMIGVAVLCAVIARWTGRGIREKSETRTRRERPGQPIRDQQCEECEAEETLIRKRGYTNRATCRECGHYQTVRG